MPPKVFAVYIMASRSGTLYVGVTSDLRKRVYQHKHHVYHGFTGRYEVTKLVYYEIIRGGPLVAIAREKQIKGWTRVRKMKLIRTLNPYWDDLAAAWFPRSK